MRSHRRRLARLCNVGAVLLAALALTACVGYDNPQSTFVPDGSAARETLALFRPVFWIAVVVFVIVEGALIYSVLRYRRRPQDGIPLQLHGNTTIEIAWTIIPAIIVVGIATMTFRTQSILVTPPTDPITVRVTGNQWWWEFEYPDYGFVTANELHLPAGRDVRFELRSNDVIHSFWFPRLSGKTDVVPGHTNVMSFRTDDVSEPLLVRGQCAEYCGGTHALMGMWAVIEPQAEFDAWTQRQQQAAQAPAGVTQAQPAEGVAVGATAAATVGAEAQEQAPGATSTGIDSAAQTQATVAATVEAAPETQATGAQSPEALGYELFASKGCIGCHAINGYPGAVARQGPDLTHVGSREHIVAGWLQNTPENMRRWLYDPNGVKPGNRMAAVIKLGTLTEEEIDALTAYLESLQ